MSNISYLVQLLQHYQRLPHHRHQALFDALQQIQSWQIQRIYQTHATLFDNPKTAPLACYLIEQIYHNQSFDVIAQQLLTAGQNALSGVGKLEKLLPKHILDVGILGVQAGIEAIELDLVLAQAYLDGKYHQPDTATMRHLYQSSGNKSARIKQIQTIETVCQQCYEHFNSFLLFNAFKLAKKSAYQNGYQPLYDFIHDGLHAIRTIDDIQDFTQPFVAGELATIEQMHQTDDGI
ncbi:FFLEELY motif protein [Moraxella nasicaprae]|uniref:DUF8198 domain-containing protein n=1 Tax=Moraxella nasicaprae TaxID=2904122 RepID=A0ABY6F3N5_9GAMM|nr:hypothetical protein [Moraxella nasicaprae]UXZ04716.1 hypothetical protein LU297_09155 [Moraxella nasicaprae]